MSLLNEVLKDLDDRRGTDTDSTALHEYAAGGVDADRRKKLLIGGLLAIATLVLVSFSVWMVTRGTPEQPNNTPSNPSAAVSESVAVVQPEAEVSVPRVGAVSDKVPDPVNAAPDRQSELVAKQPLSGRGDAGRDENQTPAEAPRPAKSSAPVPKFAGSTGPVQINEATNSVTVEPVAMAPPVARPKTSVTTPVRRTVSKPARTTKSDTSHVTTRAAPKYTRTESFATRAPSVNRSLPNLGSPAVRGPANARYIYERDLKMRAAAEEKIRVGEYHEAETDLQRFIAEQPQAKLSRSVLASLLIKLGRPAEAEAVLIGGIAHDREGRDQVKLLARTYLARGDVDGAIRLLDSNRVTVTEDAEFHSLLGALYQKAGRHEAAVKTYRGLLAEYPPQAAWWLGQAISLEALGRRREAIVAYRQTRDSHGTKPELKTYAAQRISALVR